MPQASAGNFPPQPDQIDLDKVPDADRPVIEAAQKALEKPESGQGSETRASAKAAITKLLADYSTATRALTTAEERLSKAKEVWGPTVQPIRLAEQNALTTTDATGFVARALIQLPLVPEVNLPDTVFTTDFANPAGVFESERDLFANKKPDQGDIQEQDIRDALAKRIVGMAQLEHQETQGVLDHLVAFPDESKLGNTPQIVSGMIETVLPSVYAAINDRETLMRPLEAVRNIQMSSEPGSPTSISYFLDSYDLNLQQYQDLYDSLSRIKSTISGVKVDAGVSHSIHLESLGTIKAQLSSNLYNIEQYANNGTFQDDVGAECKDALGQILQGLGTLRDTLNPLDIPRMEATQFTLLTDEAGQGGVNGIVSELISGVTKGEGNLYFVDELLKTRSENGIESVKTALANVLEGGGKLQDLENLYVGLKAYQGNCEALGPDLKSALDAIAGAVGTMRRALEPYQDPQSTEVQAIVDAVIAEWKIEYYNRLVYGGNRFRSGLIPQIQAQTTVLTPPVEQV